MWEKLKLPFFLERMVAFSIPQEDTLWVMGWDELFYVTLAPQVSISKILQGEEKLYELFDEDRNVLVIDGQTYLSVGVVWWGSNSKK